MTAGGTECIDGDTDDGPDEDDDDDDDDDEDDVVVVDSVDGTGAV
jgi:hypothetical protein